MRFQMRVKLSRVLTKMVTANFPRLKCRPLVALNVAVAAARKAEAVEWVASKAAPVDRLLVVVDFRLAADLLAADAGLAVAKIMVKPKRQWSKIFARLTKTKTAILIRTNCPVVCKA